MKWFRSIACFPIRIYQWTLSPLKNALLGPGSGCRYDPTCSNYMIEAIQSHGVFIGIWLGMKRLLRCHPWGGQGWDPVPPSKHQMHQKTGHQATTDRSPKNDHEQHNRQAMTHITC